MSVLENPKAHTVARDLSRKSLYWFARYMFKTRKGFKWQHAPHHPVICRALMRVFRGECKRLIINIPPRYSKTELAVVNFVPWAMGHVPDAEFIHTSYGYPLVCRNSREARQMIECETYRQIFPNTVVADGSVDEWHTTKGGVFYAKQSGGPITGFGAGKLRPGFGGALIIDDPHKADDIRHDNLRTVPIKGYQDTLQSRLNDPDNTPVIVIMQRLHEEDLAGWMLAGGTGEEWELISLPALAEADDLLGRAPGEALWPQKHTVEMLRVMERVMPMVYAGQYQQRPSPAEGLIFKPDNLVYVDKAPPVKRWARAWDLAATKDGGDWTRGGKLGLCEDGRLVIADMQGTQGSPDEVETLVKSTANMDGRDTRVSIPQDPGQAGKAQITTYSRLLHGFILEFTPEEGSKETRADPLASQVNLGNVLIVRGEWNASLVHEMRQFPNGKYDDQVDALSRAYRNLIGDQTGDAFFIMDTLLMASAPVEPPSHCDAIFATIASNTKTGKPGDAASVVFWAVDKHAAPFPLLALDWDLVQVDVATNGAWLASIYQRLEEMAAAHHPRHGSLGVFVDDSGTGAVLLQQAERYGFAQPIESRLTTMGKSERAISISGYVMGGEVKLSTQAYERVTTHKQITRNQLIGELLAFRVGAKDDAITQDTLLEAFSYGVALGVGTPTGF